MSNMSECTICYERDNDFRNITSNCSHQAVVCVKCVNEYIKNRSNEKQIFNIPCPTNGCNKLMERHDIKNFATKEVFEKYDNLSFLFNRVLIMFFYLLTCLFLYLLFLWFRYDELIFKIAIQRFPEFRWCKAPCGAGQIHIGKGIILYY